MVLAIGLLVDDAIVGGENVERVMMEDKLPPKKRRKKSMSQIQGALVGIAMVLSAVFIPMAFFGWFNTTFDHSVNHYTNSVGKILGSTGRYLLIYALIVAGMVVFLRLPSYLKRIRVSF